MAKVSVEQALAKAKSHIKKGETAEAQALYATILKAFPNNKNAQQGLASLGGAQRSGGEQGPPKAVIDQLMSLYKQGRLEAVVGQAKDLTTQFPKAIALWNMLGVSAAQIGKLDQAVQAFEQIISLNPNQANAYFNMGNALQEQGKLEEAIEAYSKVLAIKPDYAEGYNNMGVTLQEQGKLEEAIEAYSKALALKPDYAEAHYNMGNTLLDQGKLEEAIEACKTALAIKPDYAEAYSNMGVALVDQGKLEEAIEAYNKALALKPDYAEAHHNMSFTLLASKDFNQGFKQNEWRWKTKKLNGKYLPTTKPMWNGEKKQRVLVWNEQGIGDEIMFSSIIPELYAASSQILVKCDKRLIPLFERSFPTDIIYLPKDQPVPEDEYDFNIPIGSLPVTFRKLLNSFEKSASGFLKCDTAKAKSIKDRITHKQSKKLVGISWSTKSKLRTSSNRSIILADMARALDSSNTQLISLQYGDVSDEIEAVKRDFGIDVIQFGDVDNKNDIEGLASLMGACDMVVTIDNVTAHLAGALGVPTKLMLPYTADWRWGVSEDSSYWYDTLRLYRQSKVNDWHSVLAQI